MKHGFFKKLLSLLLAMTFVLSLGLTAAFAEDGGGENPDQQITSVEVTADTTGTTVDASGQNVEVTANEEKGTITVNVEPSASTPSQEANLGVDVTPVTVEVNNDVSNPVTAGGTTPSDAPAAVTVTGVADSGSASAPAVTVDLNDHNVSAGSGDTKGIIYGIQTNGQNVTVKVDTVTATVTDSKPAKDSNTSAQAVLAENGSTVRANSVKAEGYEATAVRGYSGSVINVDTASATAVRSALAVDAHSTTSVTTIKVSEAKATATATGDDPNSTATAIQVENATVNAGSAAAETENGTAYGISVKEGGGTVTAGSVTATSENGEAIAVEANHSNTDVTVTNAVTATSTNGTAATGINAANGASVAHRLSDRNCKRHRNRCQC